MNRVLVLLFGLLGVLGVGHARFGAPTASGLTVLAGVVSADGSIERGSHFLVHHVTSGVYRIHFHDGYFGSACPVLTATVIADDEFSPADTLTVFEHEQNCKIYTVLTYNSQGSRDDEPFNFIAAGTQ